MTQITWRGLTIDPPAQHTRTRCEAPDGVQENRSVFGRRAVRPTQHGEADNGSGQDPGNEDASLTHPVTGPAQSDRAYARNQIRRHRFELGLGGSPAKGSKNAGDKGTEALNRCV